jgi:cytochrome o ubiquinol oxidase subunit 1
MYWFPKAFGFTLDEKWGVRAFWCWLVGFLLAFMPLYALGFLGMPRRMERYSMPQWQPWLVVAALGACVITLGVLCLIVQLWVSIRRRRDARDLSGDPWNGRTLEWLTSSPPAPYNFAVLPEVRDLDAFLDMKKRGVAYLKPGRYVDIHMPKNTAAGVALGALAFLLGFGMIWHMWWLAIVCALGAFAVVIARSFDDHTEYLLPAAEVERLEARRYRSIEPAARRDIAEPVFLPQPTLDSVS